MRYEDRSPKRVLETYKVMEGYVSVKILFNLLLITFAGVLTAIGVDTEVFGALGWLLFFDFITGIYKAKTLGHCITSNKMKYGVVSKFSLLVIPIIFAIAAKGVDVEAKVILSVGMNILILSELYSIIGNIYSIRTKQEMPEWDVVAMLGHKIRSYLVKLSDDKDVK